MVITTRIIAVFGWGILAGLVSSAEGDRVLPPHRLAGFDVMPKLVTLPDGTLAACEIVHRGPGLGVTPPEQEVLFQYSTDGGKSWSERQAVARLPSQEGGFGFGVPMIDRDGEIHIFLLCDRNTGVVRARTEPGVVPVERIARQKLEVWYLRSREGRTKWSEVKPIVSGRVSDLQSATQLRSGRIVLPLATWHSRSWRERGEGFMAFSYQGSFDATAVYSDDGGATWRKSRSILRIPASTITALGAIEPVIVELNDGRVWMLIRGQTGRFYESFSDDGSQWSPPAPTSILSSDSPAGLIRLDDQRIVMIWNNCQRYAYALGGRQVLHAAVSDDDGKTWRGYREILRDPHRTKPSPPWGDHGVSYPYPTLARDGTIVYSLWVETGDGRSVFAFHPRWLSETNQRDDFADGTSETWSHFGCRGIGVAKAVGAENGSALRIAKTEPEWPAGAVRNFPMGRKGRMAIRMKAEPSAGPLRLVLTDHFSPPFDLEDGLHGVFDTTIGVASENGKSAIALPHDRWVTLSLLWDLDQHSCVVAIEGQRVAELRAQRNPTGVCYLRLRADPVPAKAAGGYLLDSVEVEVTR